MRKAVAVVLVVAVGAAACATQHAPPPTAPAEPPSTAWSAVRALARGTDVDVTLEDGAVRHAVVLSSTAETLRLRDMSGDNDLARDAVVRVTARVPVGMTRDPWYIRIPLGTAILGGLAGIVTGAVTKNKTTQHVSWAAFIGGLFISVAYGDAHPPEPIFTARLVYAR
jgi:hypothetical protein